MKGPTPFGRHVLRRVCVRRRQLHRGGRHRAAGSRNSRAEPGGRSHADRATGAGKPKAGRQLCYRRLEHQSPGTCPPPAARPSRLSRAPRVESTRRRRRRKAVASGHDGRSSERRLRGTIRGTWQSKPLSPIGRADVSMSARRSSHQRRRRCQYASPLPMQDSRARRLDGRVVGLHGAPAGAGTASWPTNESSGQRRQPEDLPAGQTSPPRQPSTLTVTIVPIGRARVTPFVAERASGSDAPEVPAP